MIHTKKLSIKMSYSVLVFSRKKKKQEPTTRASCKIVVFCPSPKKNLFCTLQDFLYQQTRPFLQNRNTRFSPHSTVGARIVAPTVRSVFAGNNAPRRRRRTPPCYRITNDDDDAFYACVIKQLQMKLYTLLVQCVYERDSGSS